MCCIENGKCFQGNIFHLVYEIVFFLPFLRVVKRDSDIWFSLTGALGASSVTTTRADSFKE
jgi:hypothetical protein